MSNIEEERVITELEEATSFTSEELKNMRKSFNTLAAAEKDDGLIDREEFKTIMATQGAETFVEGLFRMFDLNGDGFVDFKEFVTSLSIYQNKNKRITEDEKVKLLFKVYDVDRDGDISRQDLFEVLKSCLESNSLLMPDAKINQIVNDTLKKYSKSQGGISLQEYIKAFTGKKSAVV